MQKTFDRVIIIKLFEKVLLRKLLLCIVRLFLLYSQLCVNVCWNCFLSNTFKTLNRIKQGGILSPYMFAFLLMTC